MREVIFKNLTSPRLHKKDIFLKEVLEKDGILAKTERRCFYFIKDISHLEAGKDLQKWVDSNGQLENMNKRHFFIMKEHKDALGEDKVVCKIAGTFYAVVDDKIFTIAFLHSFKATFIRASMTK